MSKTIPQLEKEISALKARNAKVEADKAWEVSTARKILIALLTYGVILSFFLVSDFEDPYISALIPTIAYLVSTASVSIFKNVWLKGKK